MNAPLCAIAPDASKDAGIDDGASTSVVTAPGNEKWTTERVLSVRRWTPNLFSFRTTRHASFRFTPGQFARLGVPLHADDPDSPLVWRAYSMACATYDEYLEFYSIVVPGGEFTSRLQSLRPGDPLCIEKTSYGFLTTDRFVGGQDLWLLASGTGIAPFLSILHDPQLWQDYRHLILVHSARQQDELAYQEEIAALPHHELLRHSPAHLRYLPVVTREPHAEVLNERLTRLISNGRLEAAAGLPLEVERSRLMICGNPQMAADLRDLLTERGFRVGRRGIPGQLAFENYW